MKFRFTYLLLISILIYITTTSKKNAATGFGTTYTNCKGCHAGTASTTTVDSIVLTEVSSGLNVTTYNPSTAYTLKFYGHNSASLNKYGFHLSHNGKGTYSAAPTTTAISGNFWAQTNTLTGTASKFTNSITWTSPAAGSGAVTFNMYLNAVDGNGSDNSGDVCSSNSSFIFQEATSGGTTDTAKISIAITSGTNPSKAGLSIGITATPIKGGTAPTYEWFKNGLSIGGVSTSPTYTRTDFQNKDSVWCKMTSNLAPVVGSPAISNKIIFTITGGASIQAVSKINFDIDIQHHQLKTIASSSKNGILEIYSLSGSRVFRMVTNNSKNHDISCLNKGIYIANLTIDGQVLNKKFVIE